MKTWYEDISVLLESPFEWMFNPSFSAERNMNAMARFAIVWTVMAFLITRNGAVVVVGAIALFMLSGSHKKESPETQVSAVKYCQAPSHDNPMGNPTYSDWGTGKGKLPACPNELVSDQISKSLASQELTEQVYNMSGYGNANTHLAERTFYTVPNSGIPDARDDFSHSLYGSNIGRTYA